MQHLDDGRLQAWLDRERSGMGAGEVRAIEEHLERCEQCASRAEESAALALRAGALLAGAARAARNAPDFGAVTTRSRELRRTRTSRVRWTATTWAASVALALGAGWITNDLYRSAQTARPVADAATESRAAGTAPATARATGPATAADPARRATDAAPPVSSAESAQVVTLTDEPSPASAAPPIVRGRVIDARAGVPVPAAQVYVADLQRGVLTQPDGSFQLPLGSGGDEARARDLTLTVERIGYRRESRAFTARPGDTIFVDFELSEQALELDEIVVTGSPDPIRLRAIGNSVARQSVGSLPPSGLALEDEAPWTAVSRADAETAMGFAAYTVPGLEMVGVAIGRVGETDAMRVRQALAGDAVLTLIQSREPLALDGDAVPSDRSVASIARDGVYVIAVAPVTSDSLNALLARMR